MFGVVERPRSSKARRHTFRCSAAARTVAAIEEDLQDTRPTGTRPQTSPERSGRRGPWVHPDGRSCTTAALRLVGDHSKKCSSLIAYVISCAAHRTTGSSKREPWTSTGAMSWREQFVRFAGAVQGERCGARAAQGKFTMAPRCRQRRPPKPSVGESGACARQELVACAFTLST